MIREARPEDAERLLEIYSYYVLSTAVSFEYAVPTVEEFAERIRKIKRNYPYLVCLKDDRIIGYVYASRYSTREAYAWTVTTSIYIDKDHRRCGAGTVLYKALEEELKKRGIINLLAGVAYIDEEDEYLSHDSCCFHLREGYSEVALMRSVGKKFDRWYDLKWYQKRLL
ncbi:MAG: GNAT family N-acetyltransferase [Lachnospiraceae bacterium]|nr:GNAT family N-acetyltransferase [Lachnospiraceae bacterium]